MKTTITKTKRNNQPPKQEWKRTNMKKENRNRLLSLLRTTFCVLAIGGVSFVFPSTGTGQDLHPCAHRGDRGISEIVVFGDSLSDQGNAFAFDIGAALPPYYEGRFSNGEIWINVLADTLLVERPTASATGGKNYAVGGAETGPGFATIFAFVPNISEQVRAFISANNTLDPRALVVIRGGANDMIVRALQAEPPNEPLRTPERAAQNIANDIRSLAAVGGELFLVPNSGGFADIPFFSIYGVTAAAEAWQAEFSALLRANVAALDDELRISVMFLDADEVAREIIASPADFRLTNLTDPACPDCGIGLPEPNAGDTVVPNPDEYFHWDLVHPTRTVHRVIGLRAAELVDAELNCRRPPQN
jgi:phospholipase/lecithinase/hemolysin